MMVVYFFDTDISITGGLVIGIPVGDPICILANRTILECICLRRLGNIRF